MAITREFLAEKFGKPVAEIDDEQVKWFEETLAAANQLAGTPDKPVQQHSLPDVKAIVEKALADAEQKRIEAEEEKARRAEAERQRPPTDPAEAERRDAVTSRIKSLPDITEAVQDDDTSDTEINTFRHHWDNLHILSSVLGKPGQRRPVQSLKYWQKLESRYPDFTKAIDTATTGGGAEWAPTLYSREMQQLVYNRTPVAGALQRLQMPNQSWVLPFSPSGGTVYLAGEAITQTPSEFTVTTPTSDSMTLTAKKLVGRILWSSEFEEEAITPAINMFRDYSVRLMAQALDSAIINGDTTATHQDTGKSYGPTVPERAWNGLRDITLNTFTSATKDCSAFTADVILATLMLGSDQYIQDPADILWIIPPKLQAKWLLLRDPASNLVYMRDSAMGDSVVQNGFLARFFGSPVIMSAYLWSNMNASGIYDGTTTTKSGVLWIHRPSWALAERREMSVELVPQPLYGQNNVIVTWRGTFTPLIPTDISENFAGYGYNITT